MSEETFDEFEVSFNYKNVFYVCQVQLTGEPELSYYSIEYFSPNGKGTIEKLIADPAKDGTEITHWHEENGQHEDAFLQLLGSKIAAHEM